MRRIVAYHEPSGGTVSVSYGSTLSPEQAMQEIAEEIVEYFTVLGLDWSTISLWDGDPMEEDDCAPVSVSIVLQVVKAVEAIMG